MVNENDLLELNSNFNMSGNCTARFIVLLIIPALIYLIVIASFFGFISFKVEIHSVVLIGFIFLIYLFFIKHNAYRASCLFGKQFLNMKEKLKIYIEKHKVTIDNTTKANASIDDFLSDFTRNLRNTNFSSVAAGIFPTLGILGTFISISVSMPDFSSKTSAVLEQEISMLLGGVGTAFYVSIYGIFLSIWWIFFEKIGMTRFEHDIQVIKENTKGLFWTKIEIEKIHFKKSIDNYEKLNSIFGNISSYEVVENLNNSLKTKLAMFDSMIAAEEKMINSSKQFYETNLQKQNIIINSYDDIIKNIQILTPILNETLQSVQIISKNFNNQESNIVNLTQQLDNNIQQLDNSLKNLSSNNIEKVYESVIKNVETMRKDTDRIGWKLNQQLNDFDEGITVKLKNSLELIDEQTSNIVEQLVKIKE